MGTMLQRLGFPVVGRHRRFVLAIVADALGSGVFLPVSILYFLTTTDLSLVRIGLALSVASAAQLPLGPLVGGLVDRFGPKRVLLVANALEAIGFVGYLFAESFMAVLVAAAVVRLGQTGFWSSFSPVVATIAPPGERERWFGFLGALRNASFAIGGVVAAVAITIGSSAAYTAVVLVNAVSYVLAFVLVLPVEMAPREVPVDLPHGARTGWANVLRDRPYLLMVASNYAYATSAMALNIAVPVYLTQVLALPGWVGWRCLHHQYRADRPRARARGRRDGRIRALQHRRAGRCALCGVVRRLPLCGVDLGGPGRGDRPAGNGGVHRGRAGRRPGPERPLHGRGGRPPAGSLRVSVPDVVDRRDDRFAGRHDVAARRGFGRPLGCFGSRGPRRWGAGAAARPGHAGGRGTGRPAPAPRGLRRRRGCLNDDCGWLG